MFGCSLFKCLSKPFPQDFAKACSFENLKQEFVSNPFLDQSKSIWVFPLLMLLALKWRAPHRLIRRMISTITIFRMAFLGNMRILRLYVISGLELLTGQIPLHLSLLGKAVFVPRLSVAVRI
ncbi:MAG: hypothetical protein DRQ97_12050 [Gammaproteobacteria bacterium]|nr:MAG: hypothetical protein DRQ97_12050 [Gammaproteobacteria bacterium]